MKFQAIKLSMLSMLAVAVVLLTAGVAQAATITVGPTGQYQTICAGFAAMSDGDTLLVDANNGVPYVFGECDEYANNATISGVNGRPIIDPEGTNVYAGVLVIWGHDVVLDNFEIRNSNEVGGSPNRPAIRIKTGTTATPGGGNVTVQRSYVYNNAMGLLSDNVGFGDYTGYAWYSPNPYITLQYDEFAFDGDGTGQNHNIYLSAGGNMTLNMQYTFTHDTNSGHELKDRAEHSNIYYNFIGDLQGLSDYVMDFPLGGDTYVVGNVIYKANIQLIDGEACCNSADIVYRQYTDTVSSGAYPAPNDDMHFVNNTVIDGPGNVEPLQTAFVNMGCYDDGLTTDQCPLPTGGGGPITTPAVFENNIFVGPSSLSITNQTEAVLKGNIVLTNDSTSLADLFVDPAHLDFHLASGSPAIGAGVYPPTDNTGAADPLVLPTGEYVHPTSGVTRPTPSGTTMDAGAYSYPRVDTPPTLNLSYSNTVTASNSGTITVSGMPTPPAGQVNYVEFVSGNLSAIPQIETAETSTGSVTVTYQTNVVAATVTVPIDIYANGAHASATITVNPGPPTLYSLVAASSSYYATDQVNLEGPAPAGGITVNLSSSDPSFLYTPATVTVPEGQISATVGTLAATFFNTANNPPNSQPETMTATAGSVTKTLNRLLYSPRLANFACDPCTVAGGQPASFDADIAYGPAPLNGAGVTITSNNPAVIPNQTITVTPGETDFPNSTLNVNTNAVTQNTTVIVTAQFGPYSSGTSTLTVTPPTATVAVASGSGQSAPVGSNFANPLVVLVEDANGNPLPGASVTFAGTNVSFPSGATVVTNASGDASVTAQPTAVGSISITATTTVSGDVLSAAFTETATQVPTSIAAVSGSGQSAAADTNFPNPLVAVVKDVNGNPLAGTTVTFAGGNVSFPSGATATTDSNGNASITAQPTAKGNITITASVTGVATPATFSEVATPQVILTSVTVDKFQHGAVLGPGTTVTISTRATTPIVIQLSSSNPSVLYAPPTVTIPVGATSAETGTLLGSVFPAANNPEPAVLTATYAGVTQTAALNVLSPTVTLFACSPANCKDVVGGNTYTFMFQESGNAPVGGGTVQFTSDNPDAFPNQSIVIPAGQTFPAPHKVVLNTNAVTTTATIHVTASYGSTFTSGAINVTPPGVPKDLTVVSGSGQTAAVNTNPFVNPLVVLVTDQKGNPVLPGTTVTFAGTGVSFPSGATAVTTSNGQASIVAQPTTTGTLTITASVSGIKKPITFTETGTPPPASVAAASGSGQTAAVATNFANPLIVVVKDASGNPVAGATVTFAGTGVTFPSGATALTNSSGQAQVMAQPGQNSLGALTITATVPGVSALATFSETSTVGAPASIAAVSGAGQAANAGSNYASPLVVVVKDAYGNLIPAAPVTFAGTGVNFPSGATVITGSNGQAQIIAQDIGAGMLTVSASVAGVATPATFSETGVAGAPASVSVVSGSGQSSALDTPFTNPLVAIVMDAYSNPVSGVTVDFSGANVAFPAGLVAVTNGAGAAEVTAEPSVSGDLTVTATVDGVSNPASFSETGVAGGTLASITDPNTLAPGTTVFLAAAATNPVVVHLMSSDTSIAYAPPTVTIPTGKISAQTGTLLGSLWGQTPPSQTAIITATYNGTSVTVNGIFHTVGIHAFACNATCTTVTGGNVTSAALAFINAVPYGGMTMQITSDTPDVVPNQSIAVNQGVAGTIPVQIHTNAVSASTPVVVTLAFNGTSAHITLTVNP